MCVYIYTYVLYIYTFGVRLVDLKFLPWHFAFTIYWLFKQYLLMTAQLSHIANDNGCCPSYLKERPCVSLSIVTIIVTSILVSESRIS